MRRQHRTVNSSSPLRELIVRARVPVIGAGKNYSARREISMSESIKYIVAVVCVFHYVFGRSNLLGLLYTSFPFLDGLFAYIQNDAAHLSAPKNNVRKLHFQCCVIYFGDANASFKPFCTKRIRTRTRL